MDKDLGKRKDSNRMGRILNNEEEVIYCIKQ